MPDPVRCLLDRSHSTPTFDCEPIKIESSAVGELNQCFAAPRHSSPDGEEALAPEPATQAVSALVKSVTPARVHIPPVDVSLAQVAKESMLHCPSHVLDVGLLLAGARTAAWPVALLGGVKLGVNIAECAIEQRDRLRAELTAQAAENYCVQDGGAPAGWTQNTLACVYPAASSATPQRK